MYTYVVEELPALVEKYFPVQKNVRSVTGFSMGGGGSLLVAARNPGLYKSCSAFSPLTHPSLPQEEMGDIGSIYFKDDPKKFEDFDASI